MTKTTTIAATVAAALALPVGASAAKPENPGSKGQERSQAAKAKSSKAGKAQRVGFTAIGTAQSAPAADASSVDLDLAKANKHALAALGIKRTDLAKTETTSISDAVAGFKLVFEDGVTAETFNAATDRIKVIGKVTRTRTAKAKKASRFTYGDVDVRKVVVSRPGADS